MKTNPNPKSSEAVASPPSNKFNLSQIEAIGKLLETIGGDGHTIWIEGILDDFPPELRKRFVRNYASDGSPKGTIYNDGKRIKSVKGVYGLSLLHGICGDLGIRYDGKMGRGSQARACTDAIEDWLGQSFHSRVF
jgi:hypothetical protein